jgi:hypothetical protein
MAVLTPWYKDLIVESGSEPDINLIEGQRLLTVRELCRIQSFRGMYTAPNTALLPLIGVDR